MSAPSFSRDHSSGGATRPPSWRAAVSARCAVRLSHQRVEICTRACPQPSSEVARVSAMGCPREDRHARVSLCGRTAVPNHLQASSPDNYRIHGVRSSSGLFGHTRSSCVRRTFDLFKQINENRTPSSGYLRQFETQYELKIEDHACVVNVEFQQPICHVVPRCAAHSSGSENNR